MQKIAVDEVLTLTPAFKAPVIAGETPEWSAPQEKSEAAEREGRSGTLTSLLRTAHGWELMHEEFCSQDGKLFFFQAKLKNTGSSAKAVERISAYAGLCNFDGALCHCGKRLKHEKPYSFICHGEEFAADPDFLVQRPGGTLLASWVETHWHPAMIRMKNNPSPGNYFEAQILSADADLHEQELSPGETFTTQTLAIRLGTDYNALLQEHAASVCRFYSVGAPRKPAPFVLSSWHYWGPHVSEEIIEKELAAAEKRAIPGEVYQVDAGYHTLFGDWFKTNERFPHGLPALAAQIARHNIVPGIWTAPFLLNPDSETEKSHPEWLLRKKDGTPVWYRVSQACHVLDPSRQEVCDWLEGLFRSLRKAGFCYFKIDFTRSLFTDEDESRVFDRHSNLTAAYRKGIEAIRRGIGEDAFLNVCGGHAGCLVGLTDSQRTGADTYASWQPGNPTPAWHRVRQGMFRAWEGAWRYNDPDAAALRLCDKRLSETPHGRLSLGDLNDDEARFMVLHQFLAGGVPALGENLQELQEERLRMMCRVVPSPRLPAELLDPYNPLCPSRFVTKLSARHGLPAQSIVSFLNIPDENAHPWFTLEDKILPGAAEQYLVWDLTKDQLIGIYRRGEEFPLGCVAPHGCAVAAVTPLAARAVPVGTNGHYGFAEIAKFSSAGSVFTGKTNSLWRYFLHLSLAVPAGNGEWKLCSATLPPQGDFSEVQWDELSY